MIINSVQIKNFFSIGNVKIDFNEFGNGIVVIDGDNKDTGGKNGVGKSTIIEAICWGLFGRTVRKNTVEEQIVNVKAKKDCSVTINVNNNISIVRSRRPSFLELKIGNDNKTKESQLETQKYIEQLLNINYKTFLASIVFGQHNSLEFISASSEDKRTIIKNFLNLEEVFKVKDKLKDKRIEYAANLKTLVLNIEESTKNLNEVRIKYNKIKEGKSLVANELKLSNDALKDITIDNILELEKNKKDLELQVNENRSLIEKKRNQKSKLEGRIESFGLFKPCPICSQPYSENDGVKSLLELQQGLTELEYNIGELKSSNESLLSSIDSIVIPISSSQYSKFLEFKNLESQENVIVELGKKYNSSIKTLEQSKFKLEKEIEILKFWEIAYSEQGLIKFIIRNILQYFNDRCNFFLSYLSDNHFTIKFNDTLEENISRGPTTVFYSALSGGEKRKIDIAVLLALQSLLILSDKDKSNLIFLDEVADGLDDKSIYGLYSLLNELKKDRLIFVITHNSYLKSLLDESKKIYLVNEHGITKRI